MHLRGKGTATLGAPAATSRESVRVNPADPEPDVGDGAEDQEWRDLSPAECFALLAQHDIGRIVFTDGALPTLRPVSYALDGPSVIFRVGRGSALDAAINGRVVAFAVDAIDLEQRAGWSVILTGVAQPVTDSHQLARARSLLRPRAPGARDRYLHVDGDLVSGRRLGRP